MYIFALIMHIYTSNKEARLNAIISVIRSREISSQEELLNHLEGMGISCTQATLSRNLRQLRVARITSPGGRMVYQVQDNVIRPAEKTGRLYDSVTGHTWARGMIVIRTYPGFAGAIAVAIDRAAPAEIAGTIAGDDTILAIPRDGYSYEETIDSLRQILPGASL